MFVLSQSLTISDLYCCEDDVDNPPNTVLLRQKSYIQKRAPAAIFNTVTIFEKHMKRPAAKKCLQEKTDVKVEAARIFFLRFMYDCYTVYQQINLFPTLVICSKVLLMSDLMYSFRLIARYNFQRLFVLDVHTLSFLSYIVGFFFI